MVGERQEVAPASAARAAGCAQRTSASTPSTVARRRSPPSAGSAGPARRPPARRAARPAAPAGGASGWSRAGQVDLVAGARALGLVHGHVGALEQAERVVARARGRARCRSTRRCARGSRRPRTTAPAPPAAAIRRRDADASSPGSSTTANSSPPSRASVSPGCSAVLQPRPDLAQHLVPGVMPERVVELLEAVEVDQQQRDLARRRPRSPPPASSSRWRRLPSPVRSSVTAWRCECSQPVDDGQPGPGHARSER